MAVGGKTKRRSVKLIIQIPCLNERDHLGATVADLPRSIPGIDEIEVLVIDDGSTDGTREIAAQVGVHHIVRFPRNRGLAAAYAAGLDACLRLGADIVVNTDADNQYRGEDIKKLVEPILDERADIVIGDRQTDTISHFSPLKRILQRWGSGVVRRASGTDVKDSTSGFRAINRKALSLLFVHNQFTYTLETIIQAGKLGLVIENVAITTNPKTRESRLFSSMANYLRRNGPVILRSYNLYWPVQTFGYLAFLLLLVGLGLGTRFLYYFIQEPNVSSHIQSLLVGVGAVIMAFIVALVALVGDLLATNRRLSEEILARVRRLDAIAAQAGDADLEGITSTGAEAWKPRAAPEAPPTPVTKPAEWRSEETA
jgi:glycosyltransferase involved in cell wall biosynthesis